MKLPGARPDPRSHGLAGSGTDLRGHKARTTPDARVPALLHDAAERFARRS